MTHIPFVVVEHDAERVIVGTGLLRVQIYLLLYPPLPCLLNITKVVVGFFRATCMRFAVINLDIASHTEVTDLRLTMILSEFANHDKT